MKQLYRLAMTHIQDVSKLDHLGENDTKALTRIITEFLDFVWISQSDNQAYKEKFDDMMGNPMEALGDLTNQS